MTALNFASATFRVQVHFGHADWNAEYDIGKAPHPLAARVSCALGINFFSAVIRFEDAGWVDRNSSCFAVALSSSLILSHSPMASCGLKHAFAMS